MAHGHVTAMLRLPGLVAGREQLFLALFLLTTLNGFTGHAVRSVEERGFAGAAFELFGISAILWVALAAGLAILSSAQQATSLRRGDHWLAAMTAAAVLLPTPTAASAALTAVALWAILTEKPGTALRRAGIIFLTVTGALLWGRLILALFSRPLLDLDATFASALLAAEQQGNMVWREGMGIKLVVAPGCSSIQGISLALVFWATVNQFFQVRFGRRTAACLAGAVAATVAVNVLRIGAMLRWPEHLTAIHHGWGWHIAMWTTLVLVVGICVYGARREIFETR
jgi:exosortase/archaeosortase family protein